MFDHVIMEDERKVHDGMATLLSWFWVKLHFHWSNSRVLKKPLFKHLLTFYPFFLVIFPLPQKNFHPHTERKGKRRNRFLPQRRNSEVRFVVLYIRHPKHSHDLGIVVKPMADANGMRGRCGWVERGWTFTENNMRQIDTSRHFWRVRLWKKKQKVTTRVWRQRMARQIYLHERSAIILFLYNIIYMRLVSLQTHFLLTG